MDPLHNPLREHEYVPTNEQGSLFEVEDMPSVEYTAKANAVWNQAKRKVAQWREQGLDLVTVFDDRFPSRLQFATVSLSKAPAYWNGSYSGLVAIVPPNNIWS
ncbi:DNA-binding protein [Bifidobacterium sp. DSM 109959]|uniref:DNA-binding protein n=2 Tax=Bifidobacterium olomucense TaxID=2675324 RepID=A0A7Y0F003_9BIFI|nr:DNA-binding protein [Bifidobacterium sp. DSM 109959]